MYNTLKPIGINHIPKKVTACQYVYIQNRVHCTGAVQSSIRHVHMFLMQTNKQTRKKKQSQCNTT